MELKKQIIGILRFMVDQNETRYWLCKLFEENLDRLLDKASIASDDNRRTISEIEADNGTIQLFVVKDGSKPLGNHYHEDMKEIFIFIKGAGTVRTKKTPPHIPSDMSSGETKRNVTPGLVIDIEPNTAHRLDLEPSTIFLGWKSKTGEEALKDSKPYEI